MRINRLRLLNDMSKALPGIATGTLVLEGADSLVFYDNRIYSYNSSISVNTSQSEGVGLTGVVKAQDFYNCINKLPGEEIELTMSDSSWDIVDGKIHVSMKLLPLDGLIKRFEGLKVSDEGWQDIDGKELNDVLKTCLIKGDTSSINGIYFKGKFALSTNRWIINKYDVKDEYPEVWLNPASVMELMKWTDFVSMKFEKQWMHFKSSDETIFSVRTMAKDSYPLETVLGVFEDGMKKKDILHMSLIEDFYSAVQRASTFSSVSDDMDIVLISFGKEVKVKGSRASGNYEEVIEGLTTSFEPPIEIKFGVNDLMSSDKGFNDFTVFSDSDSLKTDDIVYVVLRNDSAVKFFSSLVC